MRGLPHFRKPPILAAILFGLVLLILVSSWRTHISQSILDPSLSQMHFTQLTTWQYRWGDLQVNWQQDEWHPLDSNRGLTTETANRLWLATTIPAGTWARPVIYCPAIDQLFEAYIDGKLVYRFGGLDTADPNFQGWGGHFIPLDPSDAGKTLFLRIYSSDKTIGLIEPPILGDYSELVLWLYRQDLLKGFLAFFFIISGIFSLLAYLRRTLHPEYLYFGFFSITIGLYALTQTKLRLMYFNQPLFWTYLDLISLYALPLSFIRFLQEILGFNKGLELIWRIDAGFMLGVLLLDFLGIQPIIATLSLFNYLEIITVLILIPALYVACRKGNIEAQISCCGIGLFLIGALHDVLSGLLQIELLPFRLVYWGVFVLIANMILVLIYRYDQTHQELDVKSRALDLVNSELKVARDIQLSLLPQTDVWEKELTICAVAIPARKVGGDLYDYFAIQPDEWIVTAGDVSGKGIPAALFMAITKTLMKTAAFRHATPGEVLATVNDRLCQDNEAGMYTTSVNLFFNARTGQGLYSNAGHCPPYIVRNNGELERLDSHGLPLGLFEDQDYDTTPFQLNPGDKVFFYTDGITESRNQSQALFGVERLEACLERSRHKSPQDILRYIKETVYRFSAGAGQSDDMTMLVISYRGEA